MAIRVNASMIQIPQGDTGPLKFVAEEEAITAQDCGVFTLARRDGTAILRKRIAPDADMKTFHMMFVYEDTAKLKPGSYEWSFRVVRNGQFDAGGRLIQAQEQHTAVMRGRLCVLAVAGGAR